MNAPLHVSALAEETAPIVSFDHVSKTYDGRALAVAELNFAVSQGEFLTLLGPSGSGKSTTLMMLAGFERPTSGDIMLRGRSLLNKPPHRRNMGVVFQNYALFPHMNVAENLAFPLGVRGIRGEAAARKVEAALNLVRLSGFGTRYPAQLSGGQQQRVSLARALIFGPDIILMDEPLGALDRQLREHMQAEIRHIHRQLGITIVYVTHDQSEALTLSDRIAVFANGTIQQVDTPQSIYNRPFNAFVAGFVGDNNLIRGTMIKRDAKRCTIHVEGGDCVEAIPVGEIEQGDPVFVAVRPEQIVAGPAAAILANRFSIRIEDCAFHGDHSRIRARLAGGSEIHLNCADGLALSDLASIGWSAESCYAFAAPGAAQ